MKILFVAQEPWRSPEAGAEARIHGLINSLARMGVEIEVLVPKIAGETAPKGTSLIKSNWLDGSKYTYPLKLRSVLRLGLRSIRSIRELRYVLDADVIYCQHLYTAFVGLELPWMRNLLLDEHNVEWDNERQFNYSNSSTWARLRRYEALCCRAFRHVTIPSFEDKSLLCRSLGLNPVNVTVIPNGVDSFTFRRMNDAGLSIRKACGLEDRCVVLFMGSYGYGPNRDAVATILKDIYPQTKELVRNAKFVILGREASKLKISSTRDVLVTGLVSNIVDYINSADICIAPLRFGSGTRLKILEWMACEKPIIATRKAAEGLEVSSGQNIIIEDDFRKYPLRIMELVKDRELASTLGKKARKLVTEKYEWDISARKLLPILESFASK